MAIRSITPAINVNTRSPQLRTELLNTFARLDGNLQNVPFREFVYNGPFPSDGSLETTFYTHKINYNTLTEIGQSYLIFAAGKTAANGNNKTFKLKLGSTTLFDSGAVASNDKDWTFFGELICNGATAQIFYGNMCYDGSSPIIRTETASEDFGTSLDLVFTGQGTTDGDISLYYAKAQLIK